MFTGVKAKHVEEVVKSANKGGASLDILSGLVAGNFSAYWLGTAIVALMAGAYGVSTMITPAAMVDGVISGGIMLAPGVFALGLVAFGFLGMGPVTIAVDSYGPVTDNAQSVYELSQIEQIPGIAEELERDYGIKPKFERAKHLLEANDGAGNTFKATAKPVLIGTAAVGATTMIFSIIMNLTSGLTTNVNNLSLLHVPFLLGLLTGGAIIYWFTGASMQAVTTGAFRAVEFIKENIDLEGTTKASVETSRKVVEICTQYAQKGMFNIFLGIFFATLAFAFVEPYFFIGYLISIAIFGLYQAIFMANAGGAWDNAKKIVEVDLQGQGHRVARRLDRRRHRRRPVQGHLLGGPEPGHQVHHPVRHAGDRALAHHQQPGHQRCPRRRLRPGQRLHGVAFLLRHADRPAHADRGRLRATSRTATRLPQQRRPSRRPSKPDRPRDRSPGPPSRSGAPAFARPAGPGASPRLSWCPPPSPSPTSG